jgi:hypothetical protein
MPTLLLKHKGAEWGMIRAEVNETGEMVNIDISPGSPAKGHWKPFCRMTVVDVPDIGPQLVYHMYDGS